MLSIDKVEIALERKGNPWIAGKTSVSIFSSTEIRKRLGLSIPREKIVDSKVRVGSAIVVEELGAIPVLPPRFDWRRVNNVDWTTSIKDQGPCGSCVAFATIGAMESRWKIHTDDSQEPIDFSEAFLFFCGGADCESGWDFPPALEFCHRTGLVEENCFPYQPYSQSCTPCPDWSNRIVRLNGWRRMYGLYERKEDLFNYGPIIGAIEIYEDFTFYIKGIYSHIIGSFLGLHAIAIVGFDDYEGCWICKNSWGKRWGERGWFGIRYGECGIDSKFPAYAGSFNA